MRDNAPFHRTSSPRMRRWLTCGCLAVLLVATGCQATVDLSSETAEEIITRSNDGLEVRPQSDFVEEVDDTVSEVAAGVEIGQCVVDVNDSGTFASVPVMNATAEMVNVFTRVSVMNAAGDELATERPSITDLRPGFSSQEWTQVWSPAGEAVEGAVACSVIESRSEPPSDLIRGAGDDLPEGTFTCRIAGLDVVGDVSLELDVLNPFDEERNMQALIAVLNEDGVRVGTSLPTVRDVPAGGAQGLAVSTWVPGFVEATSCDVIWSIS